MHVFEVARECWTAFWDRGGADALFAPRGWTEMAALRADLHLLPPASSASPLRLFLAARTSSSGDVAARGIDATFFCIARASQIDGEKRSDFKIGTSGNFYRKPWDGRSLTLSSGPPSFLSTFSFQPFCSLTTPPIGRTPFFSPSSCPINTNTNCATRQLPLP